MSRDVGELIRRCNAPPFYHTARNAISPGITSPCQYIWTADFRRCVALVEQIPEIRDSFDKVAKRVPAFKGILNEWDSLVALLKSEMKIHGNKAPETYRRISELRKD